MIDTGKWQEGAKALLTMALALFAAGISGALLCGLVVFILELLNIGSSESLESLLMPAAALAALIGGPIFYADRVREDSQPSVFANMNEPMVQALMPIERLWQHRADLLGNLVTSNDALAKRLDDIDDDLARKVAAFLRNRRDELEIERETTQQFVDAGRY